MLLWCLFRRSILTSNHPEGCRTLFLLSGPCKPFSNQVWPRYLWLSQATRGTERGVYACTSLLWEEDSSMTSIESGLVYRWMIKIDTLHPISACHARIGVQREQKAIHVRVGEDHLELGLVPYAMYRLGYAGAYSLAPSRYNGALSRIVGAKWRGHRPQHLGRKHQ